MEATRSFIFETPIAKKYGALKGQTLGYASISAKATYDAQSRPFFDRDYCNMNIDKVVIKVGGKEQDITLAYHVSKQLSDTIAEVIEDAAYAHAEYVFTSGDSTNNIA